MLSKKAKIADSLACGSLGWQTFDALLESACTDAYDHARPLVLALVAINGLLTFNKDYGEGTDEQVVMTVTRLLRSNLRGQDGIAHHRDEVFAVLLPGAEEHIAMRVLGRLYQVLEQTRFRDRTGKSFFLTVAIGCCVMPKLPSFDAHARADLLSAATQALHQAQSQQHGDRLVCFSGWPDSGFARQDSC